MCAHCPTLTTTKRQESSRQTSESENFSSTKEARHARLIFGAEILLLGRAGDKILAQNQTCAREGDVNFFRLASHPSRRAAEPPPSSPLFSHPSAASLLSSRSPRSAGRPAPPPPQPPPAATSATPATTSASPSLPHPLRSTRSRSSPLPGAPLLRRPGIVHRPCRRIPSSC